MKKQISDRIVLDTVKRGDSLYRTVYLDGDPVREFDTISDDYAYSNADDYVENLQIKLKQEREEILNDKADYDRGLEREK